MQISDKGLALTMSFEGLRLVAYRDTAGVLTIGYGHTGADVHEGETITADQATALLRRDVSWAERCAAADVKVAIPQNEFDALVDFIYNDGVGNFEHSTLLADVNAGKTSEAAAQFGLWIHAGGKVEPGLVRRRAAEAAMFQGKAA